MLGGLGYRQIHNDTGRNFQPERLKAYLEGIQPSADPESLPNILLILADDLGFGDLEFLPWRHPI